MTAESNEIRIDVDVDDHASGKFSAFDRATSRLAAAAGTALNGIVSAFSSAGQAAVQFGTQAASGVAGMIAMGAESTVATGGLNLLAGALVAAAGAAAVAMGGFLALAPILSTIGGLAAAAVAGLGGLAVAGGVLKLGLGGLGDAFSAYGKQAAGGGGAAKKAGEDTHAAARRIEQAEYSLTRAKREATRASEELTRAREREKERLEDLNLALRGQKIAQQEASDAIKDAQDDQHRAIVQGDVAGKRAADTAVERAKYRYDFETERLQDLQQEKAKADKDGIEGSDQVQQALERQRDAQDQVRQAAEALADAQRKVATASGGGGAAGGINAFDEAMSKLSPNARKLVMTLIELKERFHGIKLAVQDRLLAGFDVAVKDLADKWFPHLLPMLGKMADVLNQVGKGLLTSLGDSTFIRNVEKMSDSFGKFLTSVGKGLGPFIDALGRIGGAGGVVLEKLGKILEDILENFSKWIKSADETGALEDFMNNAAGYLQQIYDISKLVVEIAVEIVEIFFPSSDKAGSGLLDSIKNGLEKVKDWLGDKKNVQKIKDFMDDFARFFKKLTTVYIPNIISFGKAVGSLVKPMAQAALGLAKIYNWLSDKIPAAFRKFKSFSWSGAFNGLRDAFKHALNWIISKWNGLSFDIGGGSFLGMSIPSAHFSTPHINYLARGGIGGGLAVVGERGAELVRLPQGSSVMTHGDSQRAMAGQGGGALPPIVVQLVTDGKVLAQAMVEPQRELIRKFGRGSVQTYLGQAGVS